jgi:hypothetical protein
MTKRLRCLLVIFSNNIDRITLSFDWNASRLMLSDEGGSEYDRLAVQPVVLGGMTND